MILIGSEAVRKVSTVHSFPYVRCDVMIADTVHTGEQWGYFLCVRFLEKQTWEAITYDENQSLNISFNIKIEEKFIFIVNTELSL